MLRFDAIYALGTIGDKRPAPDLRKIMFDETENMHVRTRAIEQMSNLAHGNALDDYIRLLAHESADIRFWAAYALVCSHEDISRALSALDEVVAFDHRVPRYWGWHVDREAIPALEEIYYHPYRIPCDDYWKPFASYLISPAMEYHTFVYKYRQWAESWEYTTLPTPPIT